ncbi:hypothetical protein ACRWVF_25035, partial [Escherichia coli]
MPFTVMLWTIIRLIIVVSLVFITGKFGLSREFTFPAAAVGLAFSLFPVLDHIALGYSAKNGTVAKLAMRQPFVLFKGLTFQKLCLPGAFRPG